ncbi:PP2C family protein-serine/threonine phosphatase [Schlesneria sp. T3-172]|uniref:PP2C family protein-serine/threonine phosphatase n=1 Tax=Schlesneria sphaerica TaxID=3373610 RepID=UPI0037C86A84
MATSRIEDTQWFRPAKPDYDELATKYFGDEAVRVKTEFGALSHRGLLRTNNEDHYSVVRRYRGRDVLLTNMPTDAYQGNSDEAYSLAVADGIGGAAFGELASMLALQTCWELTGKAFKWHFNLSQAERIELEEAINVYMHLIHQRIQDEARAQGEYRGMGTTLTGALTVGWDAFIFHVGDSRAYLFRDGKLHRLTKDQTLAESMLAAGLINSLDEAARRFRNTLVSCLGGNLNQLDVETSHIELEDGDRLLLCTDGLTDMASESHISQIMARKSSTQESCQQLIDAALAAGGRDNVTVIIGDYLKSA